MDNITAPFSIISSLVKQLKLPQSDFNRPTKGSRTMTYQYYTADVFTDRISRGAAGPGIRFSAKSIRSGANDSAE